MALACYEENNVISISLSGTINIWKNIDLNNDLDVIPTLKVQGHNVK